MRKDKNSVLEGKQQNKGGSISEPVKLQVFEMFAGYGGASFGLKKAGIPHEVIGYSEIDKYAIQCYEQNHKGKCFGDATKIEASKLPDFDLLTGGFPCQSFSIAGKRGGFEDTRGTLIYDILRIAMIKKPKYMLLENVKGLLSHNRGATFDTIKQSIQALGYSICYKVLNSKDFGIPQNRERIWIVCSLNGFTPFVDIFPRTEKLNITVKDILEEKVDEKYYLSKDAIKRLTDRNNDCNDGVSGCLTANMFKQNWNTPIIFDDTQSFDGIRKYNNICPSLRSNRHGLKVHSLQPRSGDPNKGGTGPLNREDGVTYCLDTGNTQALELTYRHSFEGFDGYKNISPSIKSSEGSGNQIIIKNIWRRLTPSECFRLMGFLNEEINLDGISDTQKYKLAGNGWDINVVSKIFKTWLGKEQFKGE